MPKLLIFKYPDGWYFLNCDNTELKISSKIFFFCCRTSLGGSGLNIACMISIHTSLQGQSIGRNLPRSHLMVAGGLPNLLVHLTSAFCPAFDDTFIPGATWDPLNSIRGAWGCTAQTTRYIFKTKLTKQWQPIGGHKSRQRDPTIPTGLDDVTWEPHTPDTKRDVYWKSMKSSSQLALTCSFVRGWSRHTLFNP